MRSYQCKDRAVYVGADISKDTIDLCYYSENNLITSKIANNSKAIKKFVKTVNVQDGSLLIYRPFHGLIVPRAYARLIFLHRNS